MGADFLRNRHVLGWLQAAPLTLVLLGFLMAPIVMIVMVSFWGATEFSIYPAFLWDNYDFLLSSPVTYKVFWATFRYAFITWALTLVIGFTVAYFLAFHVRSLTFQIALFLLCTIPFWTSNIIRMISWIPFLALYFNFWIQKVIVRKAGDMLLTYLLVYPISKMCHIGFFGC